MTLQTSFEKRWLQGRLFTVADPPRFPYLCTPAQSLLDLCEKRMQTVREHLTEISVNLALLEIQEHYFDHYEAASEDHKPVAVAGKEAKHTCLFEIYLTYVRELRALRRQVNPPLLREPPPPQPPRAPRYEIAGVPIGIGGAEDDA